MTLLLNKYHNILVAMHCLHICGCQTTAEPPDGARGPQFYDIKYRINLKCNQALQDLTNKIDVDN